MRAKSSVSQLGVFVCALIAIALGGCAKGGGGLAPTPAAPVEDYCPYVSSPQAFSPAITVTGTAKYEFRVNGNGAITTTPAPIRRAEVMVKNSAGTIVQCAETSDTGTFSVQLPADGAKYRVQVNARANNAYMRAYVMTNPDDNEYYGVATEVTADGNKTIGIVASAASNGLLLGGAFNILDKIYDANNFLRSKVDTATCTTVNGAFSTAFPGTTGECVPFDVAPLAYVYWTKGFNPGEYLGSSSAASFYLKGTNELYILGGIDGNVDEEDCDHFDNTIIVHEYGHFIENYYTVSDSPGGVHRPNDVLDPRLGWGEAWANFFQAAVLNLPFYRDTEGNESGGSTNVFINENLETGAYDVGLLTDEGNFREFSITRILWDGYDTDGAASSNGMTYNDTDGVTTAFARIWSVVTGRTQGFRAAKHKFRHIGTFHLINQALGAPLWTTLITNAKQRADTKDFANKLTLGGSCAATSIQSSATTNGSFAQSDLFTDNDFYWYSHPGGALTVTLAYTPGAVPEDLDLIVWKDGFTYGDLEEDALGASRSASDGRDEQIVVPNAPSGEYMINVMVNPVAGAGSASTYSLQINGQAACPTY